MIFFQPSDAFVAWLAKYAGRRIVFDIGSGEGDLLRRLLDRHVRAIDIEPLWGSYYDIVTGLPVFPVPAERCKMFRTQPGLAVIARPSHGGWVDLLPEAAHPDTELLYISKPHNLIEDLPDRSVECLETPPCPEERVYRIVRNVPHQLRRYP